jgi:signal transduction histidine kinase
MLFVKRVIQSSREKEQHKIELQKIIISSQEQEREALANNLHDDFGPQLSILYRQLNADSHNGQVIINDKDLEVILTKIECLINDIRKYSSEIYPTHLKKIGLIKSIELQFQDLNGHLNVTFCSDVQNEISFDLSIELTIYRIINEVLNNILKHANPSLIEGNVEIENDHLQIHIIHNGLFFSQIEFMEQVNSGIGKGCSSIYNRTKDLNGSIEFIRLLGVLSTVKIQIPLK